MQEALKSMLSQHAVRICQHNNPVGSGFLIVPSEGSSAYIMTAAHILCKYVDNINIQFLGIADQNDNTRSVSADMISIHSSYVHSQSKEAVQYCDAAFICISKEEWMDDISPIFWDNPKDELPIQAIGFAAINPDHELPHASISHTTRILAYTPDTHRISATIHGEFLLNCADLDHDIQGMSGTIFAAQGQENVIIIGMMVSTIGENAALGQMNLVDTTGIRELLEQQNIVLEQQIICPVSLSDTNTFAYMIDHIKPKEHSENAFHYLNPAIGFWGRDKEIQALEDFLNDDREIAFLGIMAPGGCGKSKLAYEFAQRHCDDPIWKIEYLEYGQIQRLFEFPNYCYPKNLLFIVDYAGLHAKSLGKWICHLTSLSSECRPDKIRLLLLERDQIIHSDIMDIPAGWLYEFHGNGNQRKTITQLRYVTKTFPNGGTLLPLCDDALLQLIKQYAINHSCPLTDDIAQELLKYLKKKETERTTSARPLIALFITDAYIHGHPVSSWNTDEIIEHFITRTKGHWDRLSTDNNELRTSIENCVTFASLAGPLQLDNAPAFLAEDIRYINRLNDEQNISIICGINQCANFNNTILPMEPDIVGEYYLFQRMQLMALRKTRLQNMMADAWLNTENCFSVLARSIHDYGHQHNFVSFYVDNLDVLMPPDRNDSEIEAHSRLLHLLQRRLVKTKHIISLAAKARSFYEKHSHHPVVKEDYAASLMLKFRIHTWKWWRQEENVKELYNLHIQNPDSEYICTMYGKSLFNQISSCIHALAAAKTPTDRSMCINWINHYHDILYDLCASNPSNKRLFESLEKAEFLRFHPILTQYRK